MCGVGGGWVSGTRDPFGAYMITNMDVIWPKRHLDDDDDDDADDDDGLSLPLKRACKAGLSQAGLSQPARYPIRRDSKLLSV